MSLLVDKLTKIKTLNTSQPMGFRTARTDRKEPKLLLIARVKPGNTVQITKYINGAEGVWLRSAKGQLTLKAIQATVKSISDIPCGISLDDTGAGDARALKKAGCDFVVFTENNPIDAIPDEGDDIGTILEVKPSLEDSIIRVINNLPVDAVLVTAGNKASATLAWHDIMSLQRLGLLLAKPLLVQVLPGISSNELRAVREAGADGIVIDADASKPDYFKEIRKTVNELPPRTTKKHGKSEALLPISGSPQSTTAPDEDEEDYE